MALSKIKKLILVEDGGAMVPAVGATCYVYHATTFTLAQMYTDRTGTTLASNPATVGADGYLDRYIESGPYDLRVVSGLDETTYPDFLAVDDIIVSGPSGDLQFSDVANLKSATPLNQKSYKVNWAGQLGRKVSTVVHNTTSNEGGADYVIVNVNPGNLSTLVGGIWVGANHDLGSGFYAKLNFNGSPKAVELGVVSDGAYDDYAAMVIAKSFCDSADLALDIDGCNIVIGTDYEVPEYGFIGSGRITGSTLTLTRNRQKFKQVGGKLEFETLHISGAQYTTWEHIESTTGAGSNSITIDGNAIDFGTFWNRLLMNWLGSTVPKSGDIGRGYGLQKRHRNHAANIRRSGNENQRRRLQKHSQKLGEKCKKNITQN